MIYQLKTFYQPTMRISHMILAGTSLASPSQITGITVNWANSIIGGTSPHIDIRFNQLSNTTIDAIFTALATVTSKLINVNGNPGAATCTPTIATAKGWTVTI